MNVSLNNEQRLFVIDIDDGYTCFGFDNCDRNVRQLADMLGDHNAIPEKGTIDQYLHYQSLVDQARKNGALGDRTWFDPGTPAKVQNILEQYRRTGRRIRLFYGDHATGRDWLEESDVIGTVGRSSGPLKSPILLSRRDSSGGCAILTSCIVRMLDVVTKREIYRHPTYEAPSFRIADASARGYQADVLVNGKTHARFKKRSSAERWVSFMAGLRFSP